MVLQAIHTAASLVGKFGQLGRCAADDIFCNAPEMDISKFRPAHVSFLFDVSTCCLGHSM